MEEWTDQAGEKVSSNYFQLTSKGKKSLRSNKIVLDKIKQGKFLPINKEDEEVSKKLSPVLDSNSGISLFIRYIIEIYELTLVLRND